MKRTGKAILVIIAVSLFFGCASTGSKTGFSLARESEASRQQPWEQSALEGIEFDEVKTLTVAFIPIRDLRWLGELGLVIEEQGQKKILRREAWRAFVRTDGKLKIYPALINDIASGLFVLIPNRSIEDLSGRDCLVLSGASTKALDAEGRMHALESVKGSNPAEAFFSRHSSKLSIGQLADLSPNTEPGRLFMEDMRRRFPNLVEIGGRKFSAGDQAKSAAGYTTQESFADRMISQGRLKVHPLAMADPSGIALGLQAFVFFYNTLQVATDDEIRGPYGEAEFPGWAVAEVFGYYLENCHKQISSYRYEIERSRQ